MKTDRLLCVLWTWALRYAARGVSLDTVLREVEDYPTCYTPEARAQRAVAVAARAVTSVAARVRHRPPWPRYEGRAAELARGKVADLTRDPALREMLAVELTTWAARRWGAERYPTAT